jgi:hypothetical protein
MTALNGKWKLVSTSNLEEYHNAIKTPEEYKDRLRKIAAARKTNPDVYWEEFQVDAGSFRRTVYVDNQKKREVNYKFGIVNDGTSEDGRPLKISFTVVGDNKITIHEEGNGFVIEGSAEAKGNELTITLSSQGVTSTEVYTKFA